MKTQKAANPHGASKAAPSIIGSGLTITGDVVSSGEIQVDGKVIGNVTCSELVIGITGSTEGEIKAQTVRLYGHATGQIEAKSVFLASTAHVLGDITHDNLAIESNAFMEGRCVRQAGPPGEPPAAVKASNADVAPLEPATRGDLLPSGSKKKTSVGNMRAAR